MKNIIILILILVIIGGSIYVFINQTKFVPVVSIISPKGGEDFNLGDRFRYIVKTDYEKQGVLKVYITTSNVFEEWKNSEYYDLGEVSSLDFGTDKLARGSFVMASDAKNKKFQPGDKYYLLGIWRSDDNSENAYGFSEYEFKISKPKI